MEHPSIFRLLVRFWILFEGSSIWDGELVGMLQVTIFEAWSWVAVLQNGRGKKMNFPVVCKKNTPCLSEDIKHIFKGTPPTFRIVSGCQGLKGSRTQQQQQQQQQHILNKNFLLPTPPKKLVAGNFQSKTPKRVILPKIMWHFSLNCYFRKIFKNHHQKCGIPASICSQGTLLDQFGTSRIHDLS